MNKTLALVPGSFLSRADALACFVMRAVFVASLCLMLLVATLYARHRVSTYDFYQAILLVFCMGATARSMRWSRTLVTEAPGAGFERWILPICRFFSRPLAVRLRKSIVKMRRAHCEALYAGETWSAFIIWFRWVFKLVLAVTVALKPVILVVKALFDLWKNLGGHGD
jgi:hypothetical protein